MLQGFFALFQDILRKKMRNNYILYKGIIFFICLSFVFSKSKSRIITTLDLLDPYKIISTNLDDEQEVNIFSDSIYGVNLACEHLVVNTNVFNMYMGAEFMIGRKSEDIMAFHSIYLMPAISIKDKILLSSRLGVTQLNTDNSSFIFKYGYLASFGIEYHVSDNMSLGVSYTSYDMDNKEIGGYDKDLTYDKVGLSVIYGFQILNTKERNEKK